MKYSPGAMVEAIKAGNGMMSEAARILGCGRATVARYAARYPAVAAALTEAREVVLDRAELALKEAIAAGEPWAVCLCLKTLGRSRGYGPAVDLRVDVLTRDQAVSITRAMGAAVDTVLREHVADLALRETLAGAIIAAWEAIKPPH